MRTLASLASFPIRPVGKEALIPIPSILRLLLLSTVAVTLPAADRLVDQVRGPHPRLYASDAELPAIRERIDASEDLQAIEAGLTRLADLICELPPRDRTFEQGERLLWCSRNVLARTMCLGVLYRLRGEERYRDRLLAELRAAARFKDWHPKHYLDTAEMSAALAVGYDWLYPELSEADRTLLGEALLNKGLRTFKGNDRDNNWNQVCNGGLTMAALALADEAPDEADRVLHLARQHYKKGLQVYQPAGIYPEGPIYWQYGTSFSVLMAAALQSATGDDWDIMQAPGMEASFTAIRHLVGVTGRFFNYADCGPNRPSTPIHAYAGRIYERPPLTAFGVATAKRYADGAERIIDKLRQARQQGEAVFLRQQWSLTPMRILPLVLFWAEAAGEADALPLDFHVEPDPDSVQVATMRSAWNDPLARFLAVKGGKLAVNHGHLDAGSFLLEADGVRWFHELGQERAWYLKKIPDQYKRAWKHDWARWDLFRYTDRGHNTLSIGDDHMRVDGAVPILAGGGGDSPAWAQVDLGQAFADRCESARRGVALIDDRRRFLIQDELTGLTAPVDWHALTRADTAIAADGRSAVLDEAGETLHVELLAPAGARLAIRSAHPGNDIEHANEDYQVLHVDLSGVKGDGHKRVIRIGMTPGSQLTGTEGWPALTLADWARRWRR